MAAAGPALTTRAGDRKRNWPTARLGDLFRVKHGFAFKGDFFENTGDELVLTPGNFKIGGGLQIRQGKERYYSGAYPPEFVLQPGDLLIALTDLTQGAPILGIPIVIPSDGRFLHNQRLGKIVDLDESRLDRTYAYFLFVWDGVRAKLRATATGATVRHTAPSRIQDVEVALPPLPTQQKVAAILSAYDDLVDNTNRRIKLLEEVAKRIYREWFVNFRYPGHETARLVGSELGPIPQGWNVVTLDEVATINKGLSYKGEFLTGEGLPMANLKCFLPGGGFRRDGTKPYSGEMKPKHRVMPGDVIVANTDLTQAGAVIGSPAIIPRRGFERGGLISHHLFVIRPLDQRLAPAYLFHLFADQLFRGFARGRASGTTVLGFRAVDCGEYRFVLPPAELLDRFAQVADATVALGEDLHDAIEVAAASRDLLLPRLVSGEIDVAELDIAVPDLAA
jgi:type I restriction enzyme S subunit